MSKGETMSLTYDPEAVYQDADIEMAEMAYAADEADEAELQAEYDYWATRQLCAGSDEHPDCTTRGLFNQDWCQRCWFEIYDSTHTDTR